MKCSTSAQTTRFYTMLACWHQLKRQTLLAPLKFTSFYNVLEKPPGSAVYLSYSVVTTTLLLGQTRQTRFPQTTPLLGAVIHNALWTHNFACRTAPFVFSYSSFHTFQSSHPVASLDIRNPNSCVPTLRVGRVVTLKRLTKIHLHPSLADK